MCTWNALLYKFRFSFRENSQKEEKKNLFLSKFKCDYFNAVFWYLTPFSFFLLAWSYYQFQKNRNEEGEAPYTAPYRSPLYPGWTANSSAFIWWPLHEPLRKGDYWPLREDDGKLCVSLALFPLHRIVCSHSFYFSCQRMINNEHYKIDS